MLGKCPTFVEHGSTHEFIMQAARSLFPLSCEPNDHELREKYMHSVYHNLLICVWIDTQQFCQLKVLRSLQNSFHRCCIHWISSPNVNELYKIAMSAIATVEHKQPLEHICKCLVEIHRNTLCEWMKATIPQIDLDSTTADLQIDLFMVLISTFKGFSEQLFDSLSEKSEMYESALNSLSMVRREAKKLQFRLDELRQSKALLQGRIEAALYCLEQNRAERSGIETDIGELEDEKETGRMKTRILGSELDFESNRLQHMLKASCDDLKHHSEDAKESVEQLGEQFMPLKRLAKALSIIFKCEADKQTCMKLIFATNFADRAAEISHLSLTVQEVRLIERQCLDFSAADLPLLSRRCKFLYNILYWVLSLQTYRRKQKLLKVKKNELQDMESKLENVTQLVTNKLEQLEKLDEAKSEIEEEVLKLKKQLAPINLALEELSKQVADMKPIDSLVKSTEKAWNTRRDKIQRALSTQDSTILMLSAAIVYMGKFDASTRGVLAEKWALMCKNNGLGDPPNLLLVGDTPLSLVNKQIAHICTLFPYIRNP